LNPRITAKEWNLIKGAIRRVFSRSELRKTVIERTIVKGYTDETRKRVKTWCRCEQCGKLDAKSSLAVDHISPVVPTNSSFADMSLEELTDRIWCDIVNLQAICSDCHEAKSKIENKERRKYKKEKKENGK
jgi:5-methylcytosine-specific restriction endonuclease McrA